MQRPTEPRPAEGRHIADRRAPATAARTAAFLRLSRTPREGFHTSHSPASGNRVVHFMRISRGKLA